jgi:hypothetical protein
MLLKSAPKRLGGREKGGQYGAMYDFIPIFDYILTYYEQKATSYEAAKYNAYDEASKDHLATNLCAA